MCGGSKSTARQMAASQELQRQLQKSAPPVPTRADEENRAAVVGSLKSVQSMRGASSTYMTIGGGAGDPEYQVK